MRIRFYTFLFKKKVLQLVVTLSDFGWRWSRPVGFTTRVLEEEKPEYRCLFIRFFHLGLAFTLQGEYVRELYRQ